MSTRSKTIAFKVSSLEKNRLRRAAKTLGLDLGSFIRMVALREAERVGIENSSVFLSETDLAFLLDSLDKDPEPSPRLVSLYSR